MGFKSQRNPRKSALKMQLLRISFVWWTFFQIFRILCSETILCFHSILHFVSFLKEKNQNAKKQHKVFFLRKLGPSSKYKKSLHHNVHIIFKWTLYAFLFYLLPALVYRMNIYIFIYIYFFFYTPLSQPATPAPTIIFFHPPCFYSHHPTNRFHVGRNYRRSGVMLACHRVCILYTEEKLTLTFTDYWRFHFYFKYPNLQSESSDKIRTKSQLTGRIGYAVYSYILSHSLYNCCHYVAIYAVLAT